MRVFCKACSPALVPVSFLKKNMIHVLCFGWRINGNNELKLLVLVRKGKVFWENLCHRNCGGPPAVSAHSFSGAAQAKDKLQDNTAVFPAAGKLAGKGWAISPDLEAAKQIFSFTEGEEIHFCITLLILVHPKSIFFLQCHAESLHLEQDHL